jgi:hypothetical protein
MTADSVLQLFDTSVNVALERAKSTSRTPIVAKVEESDDMKKRLDQLMKKLDEFK